VGIQDELILREVAVEAIAALGASNQIAPFSSRVPGFDLDDAYRVTALVRRLREARGETVVERRLRAAARD
jgi:2-oxo-3-hexenedioate decarboxylase